MVGNELMMKLLLIALVCKAVMLLAGGLAWNLGVQFPPNENREVVLYDHFAGDNSSLKFTIFFF